MVSLSGLEELLEQGERLLLAHRTSEAAALAQSVLADAPDNPRAHHLAGLVAAKRDDPMMAVEHLTRAINRKPHQAGWLADLAVILFSVGRLDDAEVWAFRAVELDPKRAAAHALLAEIASHQALDHRARKHLRALADLCPDDPKVRARLALAEYATGDFAEAMCLLRELISQGLADKHLYSDYVSALLYDPNQTRESLRLGFEQWALRFCKTRPHRISKPCPCGGRKLRVGYLSGEFTSTPARHFLLPIFRYHDRDRFEITCYHTRNREDAQTARYRALVDHWRNCADMSDDDLANQIEAEEIDILMDLSGHFRDHRLAVFALRPAPVQAAFPIHPATTGIAEIQYILTDQWVCPFGSESQYTEKVHRLSRGYLIYEPPAEAPAITELSCDQTGGVVFGLFQWPAKLNAGVWNTVAGVLNASPNSRLLVHHSSVELDQPSSPARERVERELTARGIPSTRVFYRGWLPLAHHLELLSEVDIALDTFPFNGQTTTCECLWMGVPVVTLVGDTHVSRVGYELLDRIGLTDLATKNQEEYLNTAVALAQDRNRLRNLRRGLRDRMRQSTLLAPQPLVREIEAAYLAMWRQSVEEDQ